MKVFWRTIDTAAFILALAVIALGLYTFFTTGSISLIACFVVMALLAISMGAMAARRGIIDKEKYTKNQS